MENTFAINAASPAVEPLKPAARVAKAPDVEEATKAQDASKAEPQTKSQAQPAPRLDFVDLRLVIEEDPNTGTFVYKSVDRRTGEVVAQVPREDVLKMHQSDAYHAGDVIQTKA